MNSFDLANEIVQELTNNGQVTPSQYGEVMSLVEMVINRFTKDIFEPDHHGFWDN